MDEKDEPELPYKMENKVKLLGCFLPEFVRLQIHPVCFFFLSCLIFPSGSLNF